MTNVAYVVGGAVVLVVILAGVIGNNYFHAQYAALVAAQSQKAQADLAAMELRLNAAIAKAAPK